jgi:hypothetical protein
VIFGNLMQEIQISSIEHCSSQSTRKAKMKQIEEHANIIVPSSYETKYQNIQLKNFKGLSINKNGLGRVRNFFLQNTYEGQ